MRRVLAWFGVATLFVLTSTASAANDVLKPYVVLILDTSGSMDEATGAGPTSCGKIDNKINHAVCAINSIVNSYGDMVFSLARFREVGSGSPGNPNNCDANCSTAGPNCGDCNYLLGVGIPCTASSQCFGQNQNGGTCILTGADGNCTDNIDNDGDGYINEGCAQVTTVTENQAFTVPGVNGGVPYNGCLDALDNDGDGRVNDGCPSFGACQDSVSADTVPERRNCTTADDTIEILTPLVDGNNNAAALLTNNVCNTCTLSGTEPEIWGVGNTSTPLAAVLTGVKRYWQGLQGSNGTTTLWNSAFAGFDPINRDPQNAVFLQAPSAVPATCNSDHATCNAATNCTGANCCCDTCNPNPPPSCDSSPSCVGANCCCATQCRPYVTILLTDGDETCANFSSSTVPAAANLLTTQPRNDQVAVSTFSRSTNVTTATTTLAHPFTVGNQIVISGFGDATYNGTFTVSSVVNATTFTFANPGSNSPGAISGNPAQVRHAASSYQYRIETKPIGFGKAPGDAEIEAIAHAGGAADLPGVNEGYYAANEQDLSLAISQILADSVRSESCNGRDDDCDVRVDEDFPNKNQSCTNGQLGVCLRTGTNICKTDGTGVQCTAPTITPGTEGPGCNSLDDDCDGRIDEGLACQQCVPTGEICDGNDNDCDTVPDQTCRCSNNNQIKCNAAGPNAACGTGSCVCTGITQGCSISNSFGTCPGTKACTGGAFGTCTGQTPAAEICNGADEDCDGVCDGFQLGCSEVVSNCVPSVGNSCPPSDNPGEASHGPILHAESGIRCANNVDDDGDGVINDGCPIFPSGGTGDSVCGDAVDQDNDAHMNDGCPAVATALIPENVCHAGAKTCAVPQTCPAAGNSFGICSGEVKPAASDACNALDDDCDNAIDEDFTPADCSTNCGVGQTQCVGGVITCNSTPATNDNTCNNVDDDCDGKFDENWVCNPASNCTGPDCCACGTGTTCEQNKCINGVRTCVTDPPINPEVCDCNDNNCNGQTDEGTLCPSGAQCTNCQCAFACAPGEFPCPLGKKCDHSTLSTTNCTVDTDCPTNETCKTGKCTAGFCVNDPCYGVTCPAVNGHVQTCIQNPDPLHANEAQCVDTCTQVQCATGFVCVDSIGECRRNDCQTFPDMCTTQQSCVVRDGIGTCVTNPCQGVTCPTSQYCLGGTCVESCADLDCPDGQRCRQGMCETDPCGHPCPFGQACNDNTGKCIEDPCKVKVCSEGQWCNPNSSQCEDDPCVVNDITCPNANEVCRGGTCLDPETLRPDAAGESHVTVGGGGGCSTSGNGSMGVLLALALVVVRRRRGRASSAVRSEGGAQ